MRTILEIPHPDFKVTVYAWNNKYIIKLEKGNYEQTYKISELDVTGDEDIKAIIEDMEFVQSAKQRFIEMNASLNESLNKI
ncbi:MAG: hypothetical protein MUF42_12350 [Cytophagaceae bacterium]|jgi:hypothetical protein|nr:hypothetical protein [Cytophagaceae bacterium]